MVGKCPHTIVRICARWLVLRLAWREVTARPWRVWGSECGRGQVQRDTGRWPVNCGPSLGLLTWCHQGVTPESSAGHPPGARLVGASPGLLQNPPTPHFTDGEVEGWRGWVSTRDGGAGSAPLRGMQPSAPRVAFQGIGTGTQRSAQPGQSLTVTGQPWCRSDPSTSAGVQQEPPAWARDHGAPCHTGRGQLAGR